MHLSLMRVVIEYYFRKHKRPTRSLSAKVSRNICTVLFSYTYVSPLAGGCESYEAHSRHTYVPGGVLFRVNMKTTRFPLPSAVCLRDSGSSSTCYLRGATMAPGNSAPRPRVRRWSWWTTLVIVTLTTIDFVSAARRTEATGGGPAGKAKDEAVIEEVTAKQLERVLNEKDFVAVFWCKCSTCGRVLCVHVLVWL